MKDYVKKPHLIAKEFGHIAHHINNPLAIIAGLAQMTRSEASDITKAESIKDSQEKIIEAVNRISIYLDSINPEKGGSDEDV